MNSRRRAKSAPLLTFQNCPLIPSAFSCSRMFADLLQLKFDVETACPRAQKCSPVEFRSLPHGRATAIALVPFRNPRTQATGAFGGNRDAYVRMVWYKVPFKNLAFLLLSQGIEIGPNCRRVWPKIAFRRRLRTIRQWYLQSHLEWNRLR
jgi:hypothetical protein